MKTLYEISQKENQNFRLKRTNDIWTAFYDYGNKLIRAERYAEKEGKFYIERRYFSQNKLVRLPYE